MFEPGTVIELVTQTEVRSHPQERKKVMANMHSNPDTDLENLLLKRGEVDSGVCFTSCLCTLITLLPEIDYDHGCGVRWRSDSWCRFPYIDRLFLSSR